MIHTIKNAANPCRLSGIHIKQVSYFLIFPTAIFLIALPTLILKYTSTDINTPVPEPPRLLSYLILSPFFISAARTLPFWRKRVRFSFAAAVAVAAFLLGGGVSLTLVANRTAEAEIASQRAKPLDVTINVKDVRQLFEILNNQQAIREVTIQLPEAQKFEFLGEPVFLRAAEYSKGAFR